MLFLWARSTVSTDIHCCWVKLQHSELGEWTSQHYLTLTTLWCRQTWLENPTKSFDDFPSSMDSSGISQPCDWLWPRLFWVRNPGEFRPHSLLSITRLQDAAWGGLILLGWISQHSNISIRQELQRIASGFDHFFLVCQICGFTRNVSIGCDETQQYGFSRITVIVCHSHIYIYMYIYIYIYIKSV